MKCPCTAASVAEAIAEKERHEAEAAAEHLGGNKMSRALGSAPLNPEHRWKAEWTALPVALLI